VVHDFHKIEGDAFGEVGDFGGLVGESEKVFSAHEDGADFGEFLADQLAGFHHFFFTLFDFSEKLAGAFFVAPCEMVSHLGDFPCNLQHFTQVLLTGC
jgi:hypothetical protein